MTSRRGERFAWAGRLDVVWWPGVLGFVILAPILIERGYALRGDMVFVPVQWWKPGWLALDGAPPRFVPGDALLSWATYLVPGDLLQKVVLLSTLVVAGAGAMRMVAQCSRLGRFAAATFYVWNPWVYERLVVGQWGFVVGYAAFPFVLRHAAAFRREGALMPLAVWLAVAALASPPTGLMGAAIAVVVVVSRSTLVRAARVAVLAVAINVCWLVPALLADFESASGGQFEGFAARAESSLGTLASLISLGGIWKASIIPAERTVSAVVLLAGLGAAVACWGSTRAWAGDRTTWGRLVALGVGAVAVAWVPSITGVSVRLDAWAESSPGVSLLRDSHRYLAPLALLLASGAAGAVDALRAKVAPGRGALVVVAGLVVAWPIMCLPSMAAGMGGALAPVSYPREWQQVSSQLRSDHVVVVLPWRGNYRGYAWNGRRAVLDPAVRYFRATVLVDDRHYLGEGRVIGSEQPRLRAIAHALAAPTPSERAWELADLGVDRVLLEKGNGADVGDVPSGAVLHDGAGLRLVRLAPDVDETALSAGPATHVETAGIVAAQLMPVLAVLVSTGWVRNRVAMMQRRAAGARALEGTE